MSVILTRKGGSSSTAGTTTTLISSGPQLVEGAWHHAAVSYDGSAMRIYMDGNLVGSIAKSGPVDTDPTVAAWIGANPGRTKQVFDQIIFYDGIAHWY